MSLNPVFHTLNKFRIVYKLKAMALVLHCFYIGHSNHNYCCCFACPLMALMILIHMKLFHQQFWLLLWKECKLKAFDSEYL